MEFAELKLKSRDDTLKELPENSKRYTIDKLQEAKSGLNSTKKKLDDIFKDKRQWTWQNLDPFKQEKRIISYLGNTTNVSNAWLKFYELINHYNLFGETKSILHFDNAAFPGAFILAAYHHAHTIKHGNEYVKYDWVASSLVEINNDDSEPLEDKYMLHKNYKEKWLMNEKNNGDVLSVPNQIDFMTRLNHKVNLYTSDLGFDVSDDYENQELKQAPANIGQIVTGLLTLKKGGNFVTKQYTIFEAISISIIYAVASFFEEFYICKPKTSRAANSEVYLVGLRLINEVTDDHKYIKYMFKCMEQHTNSNKQLIPLFHVKNYPMSFIEPLIEFEVKLAKTQQDKIDSHLQIIENITAKKTTIDEYRNSVQKEIEQWYYDNPIMKIRHDMRLNML